MSKKTKSPSPAWERITRFGNGEDVLLARERLLSEAASDLLRACKEVYKLLDDPRPQAIELAQRFLKAVIDKAEAGHPR